MNNKAYLLRVNFTISGDVVFRDLLLRSSLMDSLKIPCKLVHGNIGRFTELKNLNLSIQFKFLIQFLRRSSFVFWLQGHLRITVPWINSIYSSPVEIYLQDLLLLIAPSQSVQYNAEAEEKAAEYIKQLLIKRLDKLNSQEQTKGTATKGNRSSGLKTR